jgi:hypothetical protein
MAGFEKARRCFSVERIAAEYLKDFEELMESKKKGVRQVAALA